MAWDATDWKITRSSKEIEYIGDLHAGIAPTYVTGVELHRALMDLADAGADIGDDQIAIIDLVPSQRLGADTNITLLNGYTLTSATAEGPEEHIYDTSITYGGGTDIYDGIQVFGNSTNVQVLQSGARVVNDFWNQAKMITAVEDAASSTTHRFLIKTRTAGVDIDGRRLIGTQRELGTVYTEFAIGGGTNRGNNVLALTANTDLNNATIDATIATWDTITNASEGYVGLDANADTTNEFYYSNWTKAALSINDLYERAKWIQTRVAGIGVDTPARDVDQALYGLPGDEFRGITHEVALSGTTGTFQAFEAVTWTGGTGQMLAIDSTTAPTTAWVQLLTGVAPTGTFASAGAGSGSSTIGTVTAQLLVLPFVGASTGTAIIGAFGLGILPADLAVNDSVTSLDGNPLSPPNNVSFSVTGLDITVSEEDYVLVGPESGGALDLAFDTIATALSGVAETVIVVTTAIPTDVPASGSIRIQNDELRYVKITYESYTGSTYTIDTTDYPGGYAFNGTGDNDSVAGGATRNYFPTWLDEQAVTATEAVTVVYDAPRNLVVRVRNGYVATPAVNPIVPFEAVAVLGASGGAQAVSRVLDL